MKSANGRRLFAVRRTDGRIGNPSLQHPGFDCARMEFAVGGNLRGFSDEEARLILADALVPATGGGTEQVAAARRWVPWLAAYTGAMIGEIVRLRRADLAEVEGVHAVLLGVKREMAAKTAAHQRAVPLHPHLVEQGFVEFARSRPDGHLFLGAGVTPDRVATRIGERLRKLGIVDKGVSPAQGWRRRFKVELYQAGVEHGLVEELLGYVRTGVAMKWRSDPVPLRVLRNAIAALPKNEVYTI